MSNKNQQKNAKTRTLELDVKEKRVNGKKIKVIVRKE